MASKGKQTHDGTPLVDAPLPLVTLDNSGKFVVGTEATNLIRQIKGEIAVIAIAGIYRTGKSYILNRLLGKQQGFAVGPTVNPCTKGIFIWGKPIILDRPNEEPLHVLLVDTEGIGSIQQDQTYDVKIFSLAILLSSYFVYNSLSIIDERALDGLSLVVNLTKQITVRSNTAGNAGGKKAGRNSVGPKNGSGAQSSSSSSNAGGTAGRNSKGASASSSSTSTANLADLAEYFPSFLWLLRDFALDLVDERGAEITSRQYLENALRERPEASQQSKNAIRSSIKQLFRERDCYTLVRPVVDEKQLRTIDAIPYNQLRSEFRIQSEELVQKILDDAPVKTINGQALSGDSFVQLLNVYTDAINTGAVASIQNAWESVSSQVNQQAMEEAFHVWTSGISARYNPNRPLGDEQLQALHIECMNEAFGMFDSMSYQSAQTVAIRKSLKQKMAAEYARLIHANREASSRFVLRLLNSLYEPLESKAKSGQIKSMEALLDAWTALRKTYFEQLGDAQASRLVAYDEFIKFFSTHVVTTSAFVMKTIQEAHGSKIEDLKRILESMKTEKHALEVASIKSVEEAKRLKELYIVAQKRVQELEKDSSHKLDQIQSAQKHAQSLQSELTKTLAESNKTAAELRAQLSASQASESKITEMKEKLANALDAKLKSHEANKRATALLEKKIATLELSLNSAESTRDKAERTLQVQLDNATREAANAKALSETLNAQLEVLEAEKASRAVKEAKTSADAKAAAVTATAKASKAIEAAETTNKTLQAHNEALSRQVDSLKAQVERASKQYEVISKSREHELDTTKKTKDQALKESEKLKSHQLAFEKRIEQLEKTIEIAERDRIRSTKELDQARTAAMVAESAQEQASNDLQLALEESQAEIEAWHARCLELEAELADAIENSAQNSAAAASALIAATQSQRKNSLSGGVSSTLAKASSAKRTSASSTAKASTSKKSTSAPKASSSRKSVIPELSDSEDDIYGEAMSVDERSNSGGRYDFFPDDVGSEFGEDDNVEALLARHAEQEETAPVKKTAKKPAAKRSSRAPEPEAAPTPTKKASKASAARKSVVPPLESDDDEEEAAPPSKAARVPAKRTSKATSATSTSAAAATPTKRNSAAETASKSASAMDVDFDLPAPSSSRKRGRDTSQFTETEDFSNAELGTPHKKSQNDPTQMDKAALKAYLTSAGVKLPVEDHSKAFYMELFNKKFGRKR